MTSDFDYQARLRPRFRLFVVLDVVCEAIAERAVRTLFVQRERSIIPVLDSHGPCILILL